MGYLLTRANALVAIIFALSFGLGVNEIIRWASGLGQRNQQLFIEWQQRSKSKFKSQTECQKATQTICNFENCDYLPAGKTVEEVCGVGFEKGWKPSSVPIPLIFQYLSNVRLTVETQHSTGILIISPTLNTISYAATGPTATSSEKKLQEYEVTFLTNNFILYDFPRIANWLQQQKETNSTSTRYKIAVTALLTPEAAGSSETRQTLTAVCRATDCPNEILDLKNSIIRLWRDPVTE